MTHKDVCVTYLLWLFFGLFGVHRFYLNRPCSGIFYLFTLGGFFIGWFIDICLIPGMVEDYNAKYDAQMKSTQPQMVTQVTVVQSQQHFSPPPPQAPYGQQPQTVYQQQPQYPPGQQYPPQQPQYQQQPQYPPGQQYPPPQQQPYVNQYPPTQPPHQQQMFGQPSQHPYGQTPSPPPQQQQPIAPPTYSQAQPIVPPSAPPVYSPPTGQNQPNQTGNYPDIKIDP